MSYFIPTQAGFSNLVKDLRQPRRYRVLIDIDDDQTYSLDITSRVDNNAVTGEAREEYEQWTVSLRNVDNYFANGDYAGQRAAVDATIGNHPWIRVFTGFVDVEGVRVEGGEPVERTASVRLVDHTRTRGVKRKPGPALLTDYAISVGTGNSALHHLAAYLGLTAGDIEAAVVSAQKDFIALGDKTVWDELKLIRDQYQGDLYWRYDGKLRFRSPLADAYVEPSAEWSFAAGDNLFRRPPVAVKTTGVRANHCRTEFDVHQMLDQRVIWLSVQNYNAYTRQIDITIQPGEYWPGGDNASAIARLEFTDPDSGERWAYATPVITPTVGAVGSGSDIECTAPAALQIVSFNGSTSATKANPDSCEIIIRNTGGSPLTIRKFQIRGVPYRIYSRYRVEFVETILDEIDRVEATIDGRWATSLSQARSACQYVVEQGKIPRRTVRFGTFWLPNIQRGARVAFTDPHEGTTWTGKVIGYRHVAAGPGPEWYTEVELREIVAPPSPADAQVTIVDSGSAATEGGDNVRVELDDRPTYDQLQDGYVAGGGTVTPETPIVVAFGFSRTIALGWQRQLNLTNLSHYEVQVTDDPAALTDQTVVTWYEPRRDGVDWALAPDNAASTPQETFLHENIPHAGTEDAPEDRELYYRVRRVTRLGAVSGWSATVSAHTTPVDTPDIRAGSITADKLVAAVLEALFANITEQVTVGGDGLFGESSDGQWRMVLQRSLLAIQSRAGQEWVSQGWIGSLEGGLNAVYAHLKGLVAPGVDLSAMDIGIRAPSGSRVFDLNNSYADKSASDPWTTKTNLAFTTTKKYGTHALKHNGSNGVLAWSSALNNGNAWSFNSWVRLASGGGSPSVQSEVSQITAIADSNFSLHGKRFTFNFVDSIVGSVTQKSVAVQIAMPGGAVFEARSSGTTQDINSIDHDGAGVWVAVGNGGVIRRSTDNGLTWSTVASGKTDNLRYVATNRTGMWIVTWGDSTTGPTGSKGRVLRSTDNGASWAEFPIAPSSDFYPVVGVCFGNGRWVACGRSAIHLSLNGDDWSLFGTPEAGSFVGAQYCGGSIFALHGGRAYEHTVLVSTANGDSGTWSYAAAWGSVRCATGVSGIILCGTAITNSIRRSTNNGASWSTVWTGSGEIFDIRQISGSFWFAVGAGGIMLRSIDHGASWTAVTSGVSSALYAVAANVGVSVIAGASGVVRRSPTHPTGVDHYLQAVIGRNSAASTVASSVRSAIATAPSTIKAGASSSSAQVTITNELPGNVTDISAGDTGFAATVITQGAYVLDKLIELGPVVIAHHQSGGQPQIALYVTGELKGSVNVDLNAWNLINLRHTANGLVWLWANNAEVDSGVSVTGGAQNLTLYLNAARDVILDEILVHQTAQLDMALVAEYFTAGVPWSEGIDYQKDLVIAAKSDGNVLVQGNEVALSTGGVERLRVDSSGNVGIGTTSPGAKLTVYSGSPGRGVIEARPDYVPGEFFAAFRAVPSFSSFKETYSGLFMGALHDNIALIQSGATYYNAGYSMAGDTESSGIALSSGNVSFVANTGLTIDAQFVPTPRLVIEGATGNVGIGTTGPAYKLHVNGSFAASSKNFDIPHPRLKGKRLRHASVEAPRYDLIYRGLATLIDGRAQVDIDEQSNMSSGTFAALTKNAQVVALQNQTGFARLRPGELLEGQFEIIAEDETCTDTVSWMVVAERADEHVFDGGMVDEMGCMVTEIDEPEPVETEDPEEPQPEEGIEGGA